MRGEKARAVEARLDSGLGGYALRCESARSVQRPLGSGRAVVVGGRYSVCVVVAVGCRLSWSSPLSSRRVCV